MRGLLNIVEYSAFATNIRELRLKDYVAMTRRNPMMAVKPMCQCLIARSDVRLRIPAELNLRTKTSHKLSDASELKNPIEVGRYGHDRKIEATSIS